MEEDGQKRKFNLNQPGCEGVILRHCTLSVCDHTDSLTPVCQSLTQTDRQWSVSDPSRH